MLKQIYTRAFNVLMKKPLKLWGVVMLGIVLTSLFVSLSGVAIPAVGLAISMLMGTALTMIFLRGYRGEEATIEQLFVCFRDWKLIKRLLLGLGWAALWIFLWGLIPVVGPIFAMIRMYEYRLTPYILMMEPEVSVTDAIKVSSQRTYGYKLQMWLADFVYMFAILAVYIVLGILAVIPVIQIVAVLAMMAFSIAVPLLVPLFAGLVQAAFYEQITSAGKVCQGCGNRLQEGVLFCPICGRQAR